MSQLGFKIVKVKMPYADYVDLQKFKGASDSAKMLMLLRLAVRSLDRMNAKAAANVAQAEADYERKRLPWWKRPFAKKSVTQSTDAQEKT